MQQEYGKAVVEERTRPQHLAELARYVRLEYGPGTGPGYFLAEMADGARRSRKRGRGTLKGVLHTLSKGVRVLLRNNGKRLRARVQERYAEAAKATTSDGDACCDANYSAAELSKVPPESILGLGSGNPVRYADLKAGEVVVDLGSGGGIDVFLAAGRVGPQGRAIGVDMTPEMVSRARQAAESRDITNVEFHKALIETLPLEDGSGDVVLSNCVINLSPDKASVFREAFRVLKPGGRLVISDIVQEHRLDIIDDGFGCVANAMIRRDYLDTIRASGFANVEILDDRPSLQDSQGVAASAITLRAEKPAET